MLRKAERELRGQLAEELSKYNLAEENVRNSKTKARGINKSGRLWKAAY